MAPARLASGLWVQWHRHFAVLLLLLGLALLFTVTRGSELSAGTLGLGFADAAVVLLCLTLSIGPAARLNPNLGYWLSWRRQLGLAVAAGVAMHLLAFEYYDLLALPKFFLEQGEEGIGLQKNLDAAVSWVGLTALWYVAILALTSNDFSQRLLGRAWKELHGQSHSLFVLTVVHAGLAAYLLVESRGTVFPYALWAGVALTAGLHLADFVTAAGKRRRVRGLGRQPGLRDR